MQCWGAPLRTQSPGSDLPHTGALMSTWSAHLFGPGFSSSKCNYKMCACLVAQSCLTLCGPIGCSLSGPSIHGKFPVKSSVVGCHFLLQGISPTQGSNPRLLYLLHCQADSVPLCHLGSPVTNRRTKRQDKMLAVTSATGKILLGTRTVMFSNVCRLSVFGLL